MDRPWLLYKRVNDDINTMIDFDQYRLKGAEVVNDELDVRQLVVAMPAGAMPAGAMPASKAGELGHATYLFI